MSMVLRDAYDVVVIGSGPSGICAATAACEHGASVLVLERNKCLGGILNQCIHAGFGLHDFGLELSGPEYAAKLAAKLAEKLAQKMSNTPLDVFFEAMVLEVSHNGENVIRVSAPGLGLKKIGFGSLILATGCRERTRPNIMIPGTRPAGVLTAGTAQYFVNILGQLPGKQVVILGSGDIGLIMARRLILEGARVECVCEIMPHPGGLLRNVSQCLDDFGIPLHLSTTVKTIHGKDRVNGVTLASVNATRMDCIPGTERFVECDTLLLSVGLIPENELAKSAGIIPAKNGGLHVDEGMMTSRPGIFACGNCVHVNDVADFAAMEGAIAGRSAAQYSLGRLERERSGECLKVSAGAGIAYTVPNRVEFYKDSTHDSLDFSMRAQKTIQKCVLELVDCETERVVFSKKFQIVRPNGMIRVSVPKKSIKECTSVSWRLNPATHDR